MTTPENALIVAICAASIAGISGIISFAGFRNARRANQLAASSPWAAEINKLIVLELQNAMVDGDLVNTFCTVPFKTQDAKIQHRRKLDALRDESQKTIFALHSMTMKKSRVQATKAARDKIDDSFWDNADLELPRDRGSSRFDQYDQKAQDHIVELTTLMNQVSSNSRLQMLAAEGKNRWLRKADK